MAPFESVDVVLSFMPVYVPMVIAVRFVMMPFIMVSFVIVIMMFTNMIRVVSIVSIGAIVIPP